MESNIINIVWFLCLVVGFFTCFAAYGKVKRWCVFLIIAFVAFGLKVVIGLPFFGAAPFSNKYAEFVAVLSTPMQIIAWYLDGLLYSAAGFFGASVSNKKFNKALKKEPNKEGAS